MCIYAIVAAVIALVRYFVNIARVLDVSISEQFLALSPSFRQASAIGGIVVDVNSFLPNEAARLFGDVAATAASYIGIAFLFRSAGLNYLRETVSDTLSSMSY